MVKNWLDHYPEEITASITYAEIHLRTFVQDRVTQFKEKKAHRFIGKEISCSELYLQAKKMAGYMQSLGVKKGDRVAIMLPNCPQSVISYYGALMAGAIVVQTNPLYKEREDRKSVV